MSTTAHDIRAFVIANFLFGQNGPDLTDDKSFLDNGIIDSTGVLELVAFLEEKFGISVGDRELMTVIDRQNLVIPARAAHAASWRHPR